MENLIIFDRKEGYKVIIRGRYFFLIILFSGTSAFSQHLSHQVLVPAAGVVTGGGYSYSQTIGETSAEIIGSDGFILTQGFQQPAIAFALGPPPAGTGMSIGPNPVTSDLNIFLWGEEARSFRVSIINITGVETYSEVIEFSDRYYYLKQVPVSDFVSGFYFVRFVSKDGEIRRTLKFQKM
jgi:hypothetical protein